MLPRFEGSFPSKETSIEIHPIIVDTLNRVVVSYLMVDGPDAGIDESLCRQAVRYQGTINDLHQVEGRPLAHRFIGFKFPTPEQATAFYQSFPRDPASAGSAPAADVRRES